MIECFPHQSTSMMFPLGGIETERLCLLQGRAVYDAAAMPTAAATAGVRAPAILCLVAWQTRPGLVAILPCHACQFVAHSIVFNEDLPKVAKNCTHGPPSGRTPALPGTPQVQTVSAVHDRSRGS